MKKITSLALIAALLLALFACGTPVAIPNPPLVLGEKYLTDLDYEQALLQFDQAIVIEPKNPRGYLGKADALLHLDRQADAASALGDGAKHCRPQRTALNEAKAAVAKSLVDGFIALSTAYEKLGWREIALALLKRVCEELPEESRLREALEGLEGMMEEMAVGTNPATQAQVKFPDNVFTNKDIEALGVLNSDGVLDIYAVAEKCGYTRNEVDAAKYNEEYECILLGGNPFKLQLNDNQAFFHTNFPGITLPGGVKIGMTLGEILDRFYCPPEKKNEIIQAYAVVVQEKEYEANPEKYGVDIYEFRSSDVFARATFCPELDRGNTGISYATLSYHYQSVDRSYSCSIALPSRIVATQEGSVSISATVRNPN